MQQYLGDRECLGRNELPRKRYNTTCGRLGSLHPGITPEVFAWNLKSVMDATRRPEEIKSYEEWLPTGRTRDRKRSRSHSRKRKAKSQREADPNPEAPIGPIHRVLCKSTYGTISDALSWARRNSRKTARTRWRRRRDL